jgi:hypothetical protein
MAMMIPLWLLLTQNHTQAVTRVTCSREAHFEQNRSCLPSWSRLASINAHKRAGGSTPPTVSGDQLPLEYRLDRPQQRACDLIDLPIPVDNLQQAGLPVVVNQRGGLLMVNL